MQTVVCIFCFFLLFFAFCFPLDKPFFAVYNRKNKSGKRKTLTANGAGSRTRTGDLLITNQLLYQLSHTSRNIRYCITKKTVCQEVFMELCNPSVIKMLMNDAGIAFRKEYGQNFLINPAIPERIAEEAAPTAERLVIEIGPGIGCLTRRLADIYTKVVAIEIDAGLIPILEKTLADKPNVTVINGDVLKVDLAALIAEHGNGMPVSVAANLPYYITTPILLHLVESKIPFDSITVMVQKEVADRLVAAPGSADYGAITAVLGYYGTARRLFTVPAGCFLPAPKVDSAVVRLDLYKEKPFRPKDERLFFHTVRGAFEMRRKTLVNALSAKLSIEKAKIADALTSLGMSPTVRGERLSTDDFVRLSDLLSE